MKRFLFLSALASVALAGCVNDEAMEVTSKASDQKITFNAPVVGGMTRAVNAFGEIGETYPTTENFKVYALWHKDKFTSWKAETDKASVYMNAVTVRHNSSFNTNDEGNLGGWTTGPDDSQNEPVYYWPKEGYLTFAAYSPADASGTFAMTETGLKISNFSVDADASKHYDLLFSDLTIDQKSDDYDDTNNTYDGVDIKFKHALSSIRFKVKTKADYSKSVKITLTGINISGVHNQGSFEQNGPTWYVAENNGYITSPYVAYPNSENATEEVKYNNNSSEEPSAHNDIILLPQGLSENAKITVSYTMEVQDNDNATAAIPQTTTVNINTLTENWEIGKRYTYTIIFGLDQIYFAPTVEDWVDVPGESEDPEKIEI